VHHSSAAAAVIAAEVAKEEEPPADKPQVASGISPEEFNNAQKVASATAAADAADGDQLLKREKSALTIQTRQRGIATRLRVEKKRNAVPVGSEDFNGAAVWEVILTKRGNKQKYGFSHANAKFELLKDYNRAQAGSNKNSESNVTTDLNLLSPAECPEALIVKRVNEHGLLEEWNFVHPEAEVRPGDRVIKVNNSDTIQDMQKELRTASCTCRILRYPEVFHTELVKRADARKLGFKFEKPANAALVELKVTEVAKAGLLDEVNRQHMINHCHHKVVLPGMRIEAANEVEGDCFKIAEELRKCETVVLRIRRAGATTSALSKVGKAMALRSAMGIKALGAKSPSSSAVQSPSGHMSSADLSGTF